MRRLAARRLGLASGLAQVLTLDASYWHVRRRSALEDVQEVFTGTKVSNEGVRGPKGVRRCPKRLLLMISLQ